MSVAKDPRIDDGITIHAIVACEIERMKGWFEANPAPTDPEELANQCFLLRDIHRVLDSFFEWQAELRAAPSTNALDHAAVHAIMTTVRIGILCGFGSAEREEPIGRIHAIVHKYNRPDETPELMS